MAPLAGFSALLGVSASARIAASVELFAGVQLLVPTDEPPQVFLEDIAVIHQPASPAGRAQIGLGVDLW